MKNKMREMMTLAKIVIILIALWYFVGSLVFCALPKNSELVSTEQLKYIKDGIYCDVQIGADNSYRVCCITEDSNEMKNIGYDNNIFYDNKLHEIRKYKVTLKYKWMYLFANDFGRYEYEFYVPKENVDIG